MSIRHFPSNKELEEAIITAMLLLGGRASVQDINDKVIEVLDLSNEVVKLEDESGVGTKLNYRLRWCRTNLKAKHKLINIEREIWTLV